GVRRPVRRDGHGLRIPPARFFFRQKAAYDLSACVGCRRVLFRSAAVRGDGAARAAIHGDGVARGRIRAGGGRRHRKTAGERLARSEERRGGKEGRSGGQGLRIKNTRSAVRGHVGERHGVRGGRVA